MIENASLENIYNTAADISIVCEIYAADVVPTANGFDPVSAIDCFAAVSGITFRTRTYKRLVKNFGRIKRTITKETNSASVTFCNLSREISQFEFTHGFEGLILVIRLISRSQSVNLTDSCILFSGVCEKPKSGKKDALSVTAKFILGSIDVKIPRRKFVREDPEGRVTTDSFFEGFVHMPQYGSTTYSVRQKRGGILGWFGFKKTVQKTLQWSSFSDIDANKYLPECFGRVQVLVVHLGYQDIGTHIQITSAVCEGEIENIVSRKTTDPQFPLTTSYEIHFGKVGTLNVLPNPTWPATGFYYSRTAFILTEASNTAVDVNDPAPDIAVLLLGRKTMTPTGGAVWSVFAWTDNAVDITRFLLTNSDYGKLHENWIDDAFNYACWQYNNEQIMDNSASDFLFLEPG